MIHPVRKTLWQRITENGSYKIVALFVSLVLWVTILGRREFVMTRDLDLAVLVPAPYSVAWQSDKVVRVRVAGSRIALKRYLNAGPNIEIELVRAQEGEKIVNIPIEALGLPAGVKVLAIDPARVKLRIEKPLE